MGTYKFKQYKLYYKNIGTMQVQLDTIFDLQIYRPLHITKKDPYIIDCGANIGLATLYFKDLFPISEILAFEPEPDIFNLLNKNIENNLLENIRTINSALNSTEESKILLSDGNDSSKLLSNDVPRNLQYHHITKIVKCDLLSKYLDRPVDFLKMNIEGAEISILKEIGKKIQNINEAVIEYHDFSYQDQDLHILLDILNKNNFIYSIRHVFRGYDQYLNPFPKQEDKLNPGSRFCILIYACRMIKL